MRKVLQFQGHRMFLVTEVFLQKNVQLQLRSIQTSCQLSENLSLFCFPVFWAIPVNQTSILQWMNMKGENSLTSRLLPFIGISLCPADTKEINKYSSVLHQVSPASHCVQQSSLSCLHWNGKCASQKQLYENQMHLHMFGRHECCSRASLWQKNSSLYSKALALNAASKRRTNAGTDIEDQRTNEFQVWKPAPLAGRFVWHGRNSWACQQREPPSAVGVIDDKCPTGVAVWKSSAPQ